MAGLSGVLQILPFPIAGPTPLWRTAFCWIALLPLLWALLGNTKTGRDGILKELENARIVGATFTGVTPKAVRSLWGIDS